jgi:hypothetical protein
MQNRRPRYESAGLEGVLVMTTTWSAMWLVVELELTTLFYDIHGSVGEVVMPQFI